MFKFFISLIFLVATATPPVHAMDLLMGNDSVNVEKLQSPHQAHSRQTYQQLPSVDAAHATESAQSHELKTMTATTFIQEFLDQHMAQKAKHLELIDILKKREECTVHRVLFCLASVASVCNLGKDFYLSALHPHYTISAAMGHTLLQLLVAGTSLTLAVSAHTYRNKFHTQLEFLKREFIEANDTKSLLYAKQIEVCRKSGQEQVSDSLCSGLALVSATLIIPALKDVLTAQVVEIPAIATDSLMSAVANTGGILFTLGAGACAYAVNKRDNKQLNALLGELDELILDENELV